MNDVMATPVKRYHIIRDNCIKPGQFFVFDVVDKKLHPPGKEASLPYSPEEEAKIVGELSQQFVVIKY